MSKKFSDLLDKVFAAAAVTLLGTLLVCGVFMACFAAMLVAPIEVQAKEEYTEDEFLDMYASAGTFDPVYYGNTYPDVKSAYGYANYAMYYHYVAYGANEGRVPYAGATGGVFAKWDMAPVEAYIKVTSAEYNIPESELWTYLYGDSVPWYEKQSEINARLANRKTSAPAVTATVDGIVPIDELANYSSLKKKMTDEEFQAAYNAALSIVEPLVGLSREEQVKGIFASLRAMADNGTVTYSETAPHYNDAYGYFVTHQASCAGSTRATGLCLNMLGMSYVHVNENKWDHQYCRVNINGENWAVDPYGYVCGKE